MLLPLRSTEQTLGLRPFMQPPIETTKHVNIQLNQHYSTTIDRNPAINHTSSLMPAMRASTTQVRAKSLRHWIDGLKWIYGSNGGTGNGKARLWPIQLSCESAWKVVFPPTPLRNDSPGLRNVTNQKSKVVFPKQKVAMKEHMMNI